MRLNWAGQCFVRSCFLGYVILFPVRAKLFNNRETDIFFSHSYFLLLLSAKYISQNTFFCLLSLLEQFPTVWVCACVRVHVRARVCVCVWVRMYGFLESE